MPAIIHHHHKTNTYLKLSIQILALVQSSSRHSIRTQYTNTYAVHNAPQRIFEYQSNAMLRYIFETVSMVLLHVVLCSYLTYIQMHFTHNHILVHTSNTYPWLTLKKFFKVQISHHFVRNRPCTSYIVHILYLFQSIQYPYFAFLQSVLSKI